MISGQFLQDLEDDDSEMEEEEENYEEVMQKLENQEAMEEFKEQFQKTKEVSILLSNSQFQNHYQKVQQYLQKNIDNYQGNIDSGHEEYQVILKSNEYGSVIDREMNTVHKILKDLYKKRFPELEQIITSPVDYAKIVMLIKNELDLNQVNLSNILTGHQIVAVNVAGSSTTGVPLNEIELKDVLQVCDQIMKLHHYQEELLAYIESRMKFIAPNLSSLVGTQLASKLMAGAGGIEKLANMPACNIQVMGSIKRNMLGFSRAMSDRNRGYFGSIELVQKAPAKFQIKLVRMLATNVAKTARIDHMRTCPSGSAGEKLKEKMMQRFEKIQEPPPPKLNKPIAVPDEKPRKKRGGKRYRKQKERMAMTEVRKFQNRLKFGLEAEEEFRGTGYWESEITHQQKLEDIIKQMKKQTQRLNQLQSSTANGMASSIVFTPVQGLELLNPDWQSGIQSKRPDQYFNRESGFKSVMQNREQK